MTSKKNELAQSVGNNIRTIRAEKGISQNDLALRAETQQSYLSQIESGKHLPALPLLLRIAGGLEVKVGEITTPRPCAHLDIEWVDPYDPMSTEVKCSMCDTRWTAHSTD